jgi:hypothetical protein
MSWYKNKQDSIQDICDIESYLRLPKEARLLWGLFYIYPKYQSFESVKDFFENGRFETKFDKYFRENYPIQFFFRETIPDLWGSFWNPIYRFKDKAHEWLFPRQKWLFKKLPNHWVDKDYIIMTIVFESIIHYVEEEEAFEVIDWEHDEEHRDLKRQIEKIYRWAKMRPKVEKRMEKYNSFYGLYETILFKYDKHFAKETIEISDRLWT